MKIRRVIEALLVSIAAVAAMCFFTCGPLLRGEAMYFAAAEGDVAKVRKLLAMGVSVDYAFDGSETSLQAAASGNHRGVVEILLEAGANPCVGEGSRPSHLAKNPPLRELLRAREREAGCWPRK